jgi:uncharacterized membrane protein
MNPVQLSKELRHNSTPYLRNRRCIAGLCVVGMAGLSAVAMYQMGLVKKLPELPFPVFDSEKVISSDAAYSQFGVPDGVLGIASYAITLALAAAGGADRARTDPALPLALAVKVGFDVYQAARHSASQWPEHHGFCSWCLLPAVASFAMAPLIWPEARAALAAVRPLTHLKAA